MTDMPMAGSNLSQSRQQNDFSCLWSRRVGDRSMAVAVTGDGERIVAGADNGAVVCYSRTGRLLWRNRVPEGRPFRIAVSAGAEKTAVGVLNGKRISVFDRDGRAIAHPAVGAQTWAGPAVSADGERIAGGADDGIVRLWDGSGNLIHSFDTGGRFVRKLSMTPDGELIAFGSDDRCVYLLDRSLNLIWKKETGGKVWAGAVVTPDGACIAAGSFDRCLYLFSRSGKTLFRFRTRGGIHAIAVSAHAERIVAGTIAGIVYCVDRSGIPVWKFKTGDSVYGAAVSADGRFAAAASYDRRVYFFDLSGNCLYSHQTPKKPYGIDSTPMGRFIAAAAADGCVYFFENSQAPCERSETISDPALPFDTIVQIRRRYVDNPVLGICMWIDEFEHRLHRRHFKACQSLLTEIHDPGYRLSDHDRLYIDSRKGAFFLSKGLQSRIAGDFAAAKLLVEKSLTCQKRTGYAPSIGQTEMASSLLKTDRKIGEQDQFLGTVQKELLVYGTIESYIIEKSAQDASSTPENCIAAALELGLTAPLATALTSENNRLRKLAVCALERFRSVDTNHRLAGLINDYDPFVRWRSVAWAVRSDLNADAPASSRGTKIGFEPDPEVKYEMACGLSRTGAYSATPALCEMLLDQDADIRWAAARSLAAAGDRRAIPYLRKTKSGKDFLGRSVEIETLKTAMEIRQRHPFPAVSGFLAAKIKHPLSPGRTLEPAVKIQTGEQLVFIAGLYNCRPYTRIRLKCVFQPHHIFFEREDTFESLISQTKPFLFSMPGKTDVLNRLFMEPNLPGTNCRPFSASTWNETETPILEYISFRSPPWEIRRRGDMQVHLEIFDEDGESFESVCKIHLQTS